MKRFLIPLALLLTAVGCIERETPFVVEGDPHFNITIRDDSEVPIAELDEMSAQYSLVLGPNAWSAAKNDASHVSKAPRFYVNSNMRWKVVPASGEPESWIHPFPDSGEKQGLFFFKADRNISPVQERSALFNVLVDKGSGEFEPIEGMLRITQEKSPLFLEMNAAKFNVASTGQNVRLAVTANVDWTYELAPSASFGTADIDWIADNSKHTAGKQVDTLVFKVAANELGVRGADLAISYVLDGEARTDVIPITQYPATETQLEGFPVKWAVRVSDNTYASTWTANATIPPVSGSGLMTWHNENGRAADTAGKVLVDVSDNCPRAQGVWPGDYLEIVAASPVSAGTIVKLVFGTRVSGTGHKYWRLEFRDGDTWKVAGKALTDPDVPGPDGQPVVYTHAMNSDGSTNIFVESLANYTSNTDQVEFRFICAANWQANGNGPLGAPNGGTWRLAVDTKTADDPYQPQISIVAAGAETLTKANLTVNPSYLAFDGEKSGSRKFTVSSDQDFTLTPSADWIQLDQTESSAGEDISFTVKCEDNETGSIREGVIVIKAGITRSSIAIIQGAKPGSQTPGGDEPQEVTTPAEFPIVWSMPGPGNVSGVDFSLNNISGSYVYSDTHHGKLSMIRTSTTSPTSSNTTYQKRSEERWNGKHCFLHYGVYKDDYWLFEVFNVTNPAGTYTIEYCAESSGNGPKYFLLEYSGDGVNWVPVDPIDGSYSSESGDETFQYTYALEKASTVYTINKSVRLPAISKSTTVRVRARVVSVSRVAGTDMALNHGATNRVGDHVTISFKAD